MSDLEAESQRADEAERRAAAAERAKIELTLALAEGEAPEGRASGGGAFRSSFGREVRGGDMVGDNDLLRRVEESELAATVQVR